MLQFSAISCFSIDERSSGVIGAGIDPENGCRVLGAELVVRDREETSRDGGYEIPVFDATGRGGTEMGYD